MLVEEVPEHAIAQYPFGTRRFDEDTGVGRAANGLSHFPEEALRFRDMFDDMAADQYIRGVPNRPSFEEAPFKSQPSFEFHGGPDVTGVVTYRAVAGIGFNEHP